MQKDKEQIELEIQRLEDELEVLRKNEQTKESNRIFEDSIDRIESGEWELASFKIGNYNNDVCITYTMTLYKVESPEQKDATKKLYGTVRKLIKFFNNQNDLGKAGLKLIS